MPEEFNNSSYLPHSISLKAVPWRINDGKGHVRSFARSDWPNSSKLDFVKGGSNYADIMLNRGSRESIP